MTSAPVVDRADAVLGAKPAVVAAKTIPNLSLQFISGLSFQLLEANLPKESL